jgi:hypothetical protein
MRYLAEKKEYAIYRTAVEAFTLAKDNKAPFTRNRQNSKSHSNLHDSLDRRFSISQTTACSISHCGNIR